MGNWNEWINNDDGERKHVTRKPNKNVFCRKNRNGKEYGPHVYENERCIYCARLKNKPNQIEDLKETTNE